jgi:hypothetical protein
MGSRVGGDRESTGVVVRPMIRITTTPPDFRPGLLWGARAIDRSPGRKSGGAYARLHQPVTTKSLDA